MVSDGNETRWSRVQRWWRQAVVIGLSALIVIESQPFVPKRLRMIFEPVAGVLGLWQDNWEMFAPEPDAMNQHVWARLTFRDGKVEEWHAPNWQSQSRWQRFLNHRHSELWDRLREPNFLDNYPRIADFIAREHLRNTQRTDWPRRVEIRIQDEQLRDPRLFPWPALSEPLQLENNWTLFTREYP